MSRYKAISISTNIIPTLSEAPLAKTNMDCHSANTRNPIPGMLSAPGMVPASASSRDRTSKSRALPEARSDRSSDKETVGTEKDDRKESRAGGQDTCGLCSLPGSFPTQWSCGHTPTFISGTRIHSPTPTSLVTPYPSRVPPVMVPAATV